MIEMLGINIGDDGQGRHQQQKRRVALVGLGHHVVAVPESHVASARAQISANRDRRIEPRLFEDEADQTGSGGLAMGPGDGDTNPRHPQQLAEHLGARDDRYFQFARACHLGIGKFHRGRNHHRVEFRLDVYRLMTGIDLRAQRLEPRGHRAIFQIASADREAEAQRQLGNSAHPGTADPDEM